MGDVWFLLFTDFSWGQMNVAVFGHARDSVLSPSTNFYVKQSCWDTTWLLDIMAVDFSWQHIATNIYLIINMILSLEIIFAKPTEDLKKCMSWLWWKLMSLDILKSTWPKKCYGTGSNITCVYAPLNITVWPIVTARTITGGSQTWKDLKDCTQQNVLPYSSRGCHRLKWQRKKEDQEYL